jgi:hypothetical protein
LDNFNHVAIGIVSQHVLTAQRRRAFAGLRKACRLALKSRADLTQAAVSGLDVRYLDTDDDISYSEADQVSARDGKRRTIVPQQHHERAGVAAS